MIKDKVLEEIRKHVMTSKEISKYCEESTEYKKIEWIDLDFVEDILQDIK